MGVKDSLKRPIEDKYKKLKRPKLSLDGQLDGQKHIFRPFKPPFFELKAISASKKEGKLQKYRSKGRVNKHKILYQNIFN